MASSVNALTEHIPIVVRSIFKVSETTMRSSSALMLHFLRQHATRMSAKTSLQTSPLVSVLPHLLRPESSTLTSLYSLHLVLPYSIQAVESQVRVTVIQLTSLVISLLEDLHFVLTILLWLQRTNLFNAHPKSLQFDRGTDEPKPEVATSRLRQALLTISGFYSKESQLLRGGPLSHSNTIAGASYL